MPWIIILGIKGYEQGPKPSLMTYSMDPRTLMLLGSIVHHKHVLGPCQWLGDEMKGLFFK